MEPTVSTFLRTLRRRAWVVIACAVLVPVSAFVVSSRQPPVYSSTAQVYINKQNLASALTGIEDTTLFIDAERAAATQATLAVVPVVARRALEIAEVTDRSPSELISNSTVSPKGSTDVLEFQVEDRFPRTAERLASAYAVAFTRYRGELDTRAITKARQEVTSKLQRLRAQGRQSSSIYAALEESEQKLETLETLQTSRAYVIRGADKAEQIAPHPLRDAALGFVFGLVLGIGLAFLLDALDTRARSAAEVGEGLGQPLLARLPAPPRDLAKADTLVMSARPESAAAEPFRMLRANLEFSRLGGDGVRTVLVTSAIEGEGKSTTAANLAIALARSGQRVALVDLDFRRPYLYRFFHVDHALGVTDVALGRTTIARALHHVNVSSGLFQAKGNSAQAELVGALAVLVTGPLPPDPGEFVGTNRLASILGELRSTHDLIVLDTPPMLRVGDALTLSSRADGILVVARLNVLKRPMLSELRRLLESTATPKLGFVAAGDDENAPYGYYYDHGHGTDSRKTRKMKKTSPAQDASRV